MFDANHVFVTPKITEVVRNGNVREALLKIPSPSDGSRILAERANEAAKK